MKLGIIGGGAMGEAVLAGVLRRKLLKPTEISVAEKIKERARDLQEKYGVTAGGDSAAAAGSDYVLLAVKPQDAGTLAPLARKVRPDATVLSIMAGVTIARISELLGHKAVVRAMPNTPAQVGEGMTLWTATPEVAEAARKDVAAIFESLGRQAFLPEERFIDMATAVSASGPGFVLLLIEAMVDAGVHIGLSRDLATEMVLQTFAGSARLAQETGRHPAELRNMVTSPGGTTAEGLKALEAAGVRAALIEAVQAAYNRSKALGG